jgi:hypothetical protein
MRSTIKTQRFSENGAFLAKPNKDRGLYFRADFPFARIQSYNLWHAISTAIQPANDVDLGGYS